MISEKPLSYPTESLRERFDAKWIPEPNSGCWLWEAFTNAGGYGQMTIGKRSDGTILAHRAAWIIYRGDIPEGLGVLHRCDNPPCVNPDHLFLGTEKDNMQDCSRKNRVNKTIKLRGVDHANSKLNEAAVRHIRSTRGNTAALAAEYGVTTANIKYVRRGVTWRHVV